MHFKKSLNRVKRGKNAGSYKESITITTYINHILISCLKPWYDELKRLGKRPIFMQDGASIHGAKEVKLWLRQHGIETLEFSPSSFDLNPDEYMWKVDKAAIRRYFRLVTNETELYTSARNEWLRIGDSGRFIKWIASMSNRCRAVIRNRGFSTKY